VATSSVDCSYLHDGCVVTVTSPSQACASFGGHSQIRPGAWWSGIGEVIDAAGGSFLMGYTALSRRLVVGP
jgi:hypothetical protein